MKTIKQDYTNKFRGLTRDEFLKQFEKIEECPDAAIPYDKYQHRVTGERVDMQRAFPKIVCLCGSTKFWKEFQKWNLKLTLEYKIVLSIGAATGTDDEHFGNLSRLDYEKVKRMLDGLHLRKIDLCDEVFVLNVGGYIGESTRNEIEYAKSIGKPVSYLEPVEGVVK